MGIEAVIPIITVQDEVKSFFVIATLVFLIPLGFSRLEVLHEHLGHGVRGLRR